MAREIHTSDIDVAIGWVLKARHIYGQVMNGLPAVKLVREDVLLQLRKLKKKGEDLETQIQLDHENDVSF